MMRRLLAILLLVLEPAAAPGAEIIGSVGLDDLRGDPVPSIALELRTSPFFETARFTLALGIAAETDSDVWTGAGPVALIPISDLWRIEASLMVGAHSSHGGNDLGNEFPMFRSQIGASRALGGGWRAGLAVNHKSNASTASSNPGVETLLISISREF